jgi:hypothetical protein
MARAHGRGKSGKFLGSLPFLRQRRQDDGKILRGDLAVHHVAHELLGLGAIEVTARPQPGHGVFVVAHPSPRKLRMIEVPEGVPMLSG